VIGAGQSDLTVVFAQLNPDAGWEGVGAFVVLGRPGAARSHRVGDRHDLLGLSAVPVGEVIFEEHLVPEEDRLRGGGDLIAASGRLFARLQLQTAARQVGLARAAYEYALEFTQERRAFGKVVAHFQAVSFTLAEMLMEVDAARLLLWQAAATADRGTLDLRRCAEAALAASAASFTVADGCVQLLGGAGYIQDYPAEKWLRESKALALLSGSAELWQQIVSSEALGVSMTGDPPLPGPALQPVLT
jgi:alkylation response protein AidB-like acyl-CoA dehydrogenase